MGEGPELRSRLKCRQAQEPILKPTEHCIVGQVPGARCQVHAADLLAIFNLSGGKEGAEHAWILLIFPLAELLPTFPSFANIVSGRWNFCSCMYQS